MYAWIHTTPLGLGSRVRARGLAALLLCTFVLNLGGSIVTVVLGAMLFPFCATLGVKPLGNHVYARLSMPYDRHRGRMPGYRGIEVLNEHTSLLYTFAQSSQGRAKAGIKTEGWGRANRHYHVGRDARGVVNQDLLINIASRLIAARHQ